MWICFLCKFQSKSGSIKECFMFNKGKRQDFAKNYGGADAAEQLACWPSSQSSTSACAPWWRPRYCAPPRPHRPAAGMRVRPCTQEYPPAPFTPVRPAPPASFGRCATWLPAPAGGRPRHKPCRADACLAHKRPYLANILQIDHRQLALADVAEVRWLFEPQRITLWHRLLGCISRQLAIAEALAGGGMNDLVLHCLTCATGTPQRAAAAASSI